MNNSLRIPLKTFALASVLALAACQTAPRDNAALAQAREAVRSAEANADIAKYAANDLDRARKLLVNAQSAAKEHGANHKLASHYAYLAAQTAHVAEQRALEQVAIARVKAGENDRQQILLSARENEASRALAQAREAQAAAEQARGEALSAQTRVAEAQAENQRLASELQAAQIQAAQTSRGMVLTLDDVLFDTGKAELKSGSQRAIGQIATFLSENPERRVQVEGFTDSQGSDEFNRELSQRRADAVASAIIQRGVQAERVRALGYGEEFPVASNGSAGSRQLNRRVEIVVSNGDAAIPARTGSQ